MRNDTFETRDAREKFFFRGIRPRKNLRLLIAWEILKGMLLMSGIVGAAFVALNLWR